MAISWPVAEEWGEAMRISSRGEYGLRAMFDLALHYGQGPISLKVIAERQALSEHYLEQLMGSLRKSGLVNSVRGAQGGYELALPAEEVRIGDVIRALEGPVLGVEPQQGREPAGREALDAYWAQLTADINEVLDKTTLAQLKQEAERARARRGSYMFHI